MDCLILNINLKSGQCRIVGEEKRIFSTSTKQGRRQQQNKQTSRQLQVPLSGAALLATTGYPDFQIETPLLLHHPSSRTKQVTGASKNEREKSDSLL